MRWKKVSRWPLMLRLMLGLYSDCVRVTDGVIIIFLRYGVATILKIPFNVYILASVYLMFNYEVDKGSSVSNQGNK